jgi:PAS domain S-box-containing protein
MLRKRIGDVLTPKVIGVAPGTPVAEAVEIMHSRRISCILVLEDDRPVGIITERVLVGAAVGQGGDLAGRTVRDVMRSPVCSATRETHIYEAYNLLQTSRVRHLAVVDERGKAVGVVTQSNLIEPLGIEHFAELRRLVHVMAASVVTVERGFPLRDALALMHKRAISCVVVAEEDMPVGIITERDVVRALAGRKDITRLVAEDLMTSPVRTAPLDMPLHEALLVFKRERLRRLVVVNERGETAGVVTQSDIVDSLRSKYIDVLIGLILEKEEKYRSIFENSDIAIFRAARDGRILVANPALVRLLGYEFPDGLYDCTEALSRQMAEEPDHRAEILGAAEEIGGVRKIETRLVRSDGKLILVQMSLRCVAEKGSRERYLEAFVEDITERKRYEAELTRHRDHLEDAVRARTAELNRMNKLLNIEIAERKLAEEALAEQGHKLEQMVEQRTAELARKATELEEANRRLTELDQMKSAFLSSVSHELRTPLTSIMGFAKLIRRDFQKIFLPESHTRRKADKKAERIDRNLEIIALESERLTMMINDVLDLAKIEAGQVHWREIETPVPRLLERAAASVAGQFVEKPRVALKVEFKPELPHVRVDPDRVHQVLINLLNNAAKFTERGRVTVSALRAGGDMVRICVADTGCGIAREDQGSIFDKFQQSSRGDILENKPRGTGLGLAICKQIVEHYGGRIWVESEPGKGSTFCFELPALAAAQTPR